MNSKNRGAPAHQPRHYLALLALPVFLAGCGADSSTDSSQKAQGVTVSSSVQTPGPRIAYVNSTGYANSLKVVWDAVPGASQYALNKTVGNSSSLIWVDGTEYIDDQQASGQLVSYSLISSSATEGLSPAGKPVFVRNNRPLVERLKANLRAAPSRDAAMRLLRHQFARNFDRIFVGQDADGLSYGDRAMLFSFFMAHNFAPYGNSNMTQLMALLREPVLDCDNYAVFAAIIFDVITDGRRPTSIEFFGFDGGPVGNHAQLVYTPDAGGEAWLVDPSLGLIAKYDSTEDFLNGGKPKQFFDYYAYLESNAQPADIGPWFERTKKAILTGGYSKDHVIYRFGSLKSYLKGSDY